MKYSIHKISKLFTVICFTVVIFNPIYGQSNSQENLLVGVWSFSEAPSIDKMDQDIKDDLAVSTQLQEHITAFYSGRQLMFTNEGAFSILLGTGQRLDGQWSLNTGTLTMLDTSGVTTTYQIGGLDATNLVLIAPTSNDLASRTLFPELYFIKSQ
ncbi:hypothetical protein [Costertonia aggregata]|uniref:Lipocalin-like domain-containing protein n=1 Tax=Costertonia aggregata TaxID=343403 RepID=A0A7H9ATK8_9FLAO|nr:hypothetical protein [Costertonia aggregata]QLG46779.1 hypothetical protein HYG79_15945 [Costertonia aggregata]